MYLIHGFPGAGKTTYAKKLEKETGAHRYTADEWMRERHGPNPPPARFASYLTQIKEDILADAALKYAQGRDVILDYGFWKHEDRQRYRKIAIEMGFTPALHYIYADNDEMERRVLERTQELPDGQLIIDQNAIHEFRKSFESLHDDEERIEIKM